MYSNIFLFLRWVNLISKKEEIKIKDGNIKFCFEISKFGFCGNSFKTLTYDKIKIIPTNANE